MGLALEPGQHRGDDHGDPDHHPGDLCPAGDCVGVDAGGDQVDGVDVIALSFTKDVPYNGVRTGSNLSSDATTSG